MEENLKDMYQEFQEMLQMFGPGEAEYYYSFITYTIEVQISAND